MALLPHALSAIRRRTPLALCLTLIGSAAAASPLVSEGDLAWSVPGREAEASLGVAVAVAGDVDDDGLLDYVVGAYLEDVGGNDAGVVRVYSGAGGGVLHTFEGSPGDEFGLSVDGAGDVNADGHGDVVVGAPGAGYAQVFCGDTGTLLHTFVGDHAGDGFGSAVSAAGDLDGDGLDDVLVGAPRSDLFGNDAGLARVFSGDSGLEIREIPGYAAGTGLGAALDRAGRVDADNVDDLVLGTLSTGNRARVYSGADASLIHDFQGDGSLDWFGTAVAGAGDLDLDGRDDLVVGAPGGLLANGYVRTFSGADGAELHTVFGSSDVELFGWSVSSAGDVDADGRTDVIVGAPFAESGGLFGTGRAVVLSGADASELYEVTGPVEDAGLGWSVAGARTSLLLAGAPTAGTGGAAFAFDNGDQPIGRIYCRPGVTSSTGLAGVMTVQGSRSIADDDLRFTATQLPSGNIGYFIMGTGMNTFTPPGSVGPICVAPGIKRYLPPVGMTNELGDGFTRNAGTSGPVSGQITAGSTWSFQAWHRDGMSPSNLTDAVSVAFRP